MKIYPDERSDSMPKSMCTACFEKPVSSRGDTICYDCKLKNMESMALDIEQENELRKETLNLAKSVRCFTADTPQTAVVHKEIGLVFGNSSKQAFWGLSTQADRLTRAYEVALANLKYDAAALGANAVIGIKFALNNSTGSGNQLLTGSSEAVMLLGTAVVLK